MLSNPPCTSASYKTVSIPIQKIHAQPQQTVEQFFREKEESVVVQVGYVYKETDDLLCLVDSYFKDDKMYGTIHKIPKGCIESMVTLKG